MTVGKLHRILGELITAGHGRKPVCVAKETFVDNRESDGVTILNLYTVRRERIAMADDDGGIAINKDGSEKSRAVVVLGGWASDRS